MAKTEEKIEQQESDDTTKKAEEIGKDIGIEKPEEELPDYEVIEEDDKPLAKEREERPKLERKQLSNKEKRELRKKRVHDKFQAKDAEIEKLRQENEQIKRWKTEVDGKLAGIDRSEVEAAWNTNVSAFNQAEKDHMDAFKEGDGEKATKAMRVMYDAQRNIEKLQALKQQIEKAPAQEHVAQAPDRAVVNKAKEWASRQTWYRADGSDEDSEIAKAISGKLVSEGYDPKTDDFWDELDDRLEKRGIGTDEEDDEPEEVPAPKRRSPPVGGGVKRGDVSGKVPVSLPTVYIQHLKDKGWWDDPKMKAKMIKRYLDTQKEQTA